jgi:cell division septal protein FtsQ
MAKRVGANRRQKLAARRAKRKNGKAVLKTLSTIVSIGLVGFSAALGARKAAGWARDVDCLKVDAIAVRGAEHVDSAAVLAAAGIQTGMSLLGIKTGAVREKLRGNVWIKRVRLWRLPTGKVTITVTERTPIALVNLGTIHQVDDQGVLLPLTPGECTNAPVFSGLRDTLGADSLRRLDAVSLARLRRLLKTLRRSKASAAGRVCQVRFDDQGRLAVKLEGSRTVIRIEEQRVAEGFERLERLTRFADAHGEDMKHINLCFGNRAYVR